MLFKLLLVLNLYNGYHSLPNIQCNERLDVSINRIQRMYKNPSAIIFEKYYLTDVKFLDHYTGQEIPTGFLPSMFFTIRKDNFKVVKLPDCRKYSVCIKFGYQSWDHTIYYRNYIEYEGIDY